MEFRRVLFRSGEHEVAGCRSAHVVVEAVAGAVRVALRRPQVGAVDLLTDGLLVVDPPVARHATSLARRHGAARGGTRRNEAERGGTVARNDEWRETTRSGRCVRRSEAHTSELQSLMRI